MFDFIRNKNKNFFKSILILLVLTALSISAYRGRLHTTLFEADSLKIGSFVESDFPFISTSINAGKLGSGYPKVNFAPRTLAIKLGDSAYFCFDTNLLRWSVAWTQSFMPMALMPQVSYSDFFNKSNKLATIGGEPQLATSNRAGWSLVGNMQSGSADFDQWAPLPVAEGRWNGLYLVGNHTVLNYSVGKSNIHEAPSSIQFSGQTAFTRTFKIDKITEALRLVPAEVANGSSTELKGAVAYIYQGSGKDTVTAVAILGKPGKKLKIDIEKNSTFVVDLPTNGQASEVSVLIWKGPSALKKQFEKIIKKTKPSFPEYEKGGSSYWPEVITTQGMMAPDTAAYVTDKLTLPIPNKWERNVRVADIAFFKDGRAAVITFEGDVWTIGGISQNLQNLKWQRFASGFNESMSIEIVNDQVFVFDRNGITKLHDLNKDGMADYYENFSNIMEQSSEGREWAADMVHARDGGFYIALGGSLSNGPGVTPVVAKGFRKGSKHNGSILKISDDGREIEVIATGLRGPYLGYNPEKDILTASDQQGNFVPSTPLFVVKKGDFFGVPPTAHRNDNPKVTPTLTWIPHNVDQSAIGQAWITGNKMGPMNGDLIHFSFGRPGLFRVLIDSTSKILQGGLTAINADYPAPTSKGALSPVDEQLYVAGFNLWGSNSRGLSALLRLRYTGKPSYMVNEYHGGKEGIVLGFDSELDEAAVKELSNFEVKRYNYLRTEEYGSGHYKLDGSKGEEKLPVVASYLSADKKQILLMIPDMKEVMQMEIAYTLKAKDGHVINDQFWYTINSVNSMDLAKYGFGKVDLAILSKPIQVNDSKKADVASAEQGLKIFRRTACAGCHSEGTRTKGMYGPPFQGLYGAKREFEDGTSAIADDTYIRESIFNPAKKVVKGYNPEMPSFEGILTETDIQSVTLYIKSLNGK